MLAEADVVFGGVFVFCCCCCFVFLCALALEGPAAVGWASFTAGTSAPGALSPLRRATAHLKICRSCWRSLRERSMVVRTRWGSASKSAGLQTPSVYRAEENGWPRDPLCCYTTHSIYRGAVFVRCNHMIVDHCWGQVPCVLQLSNPGDSATTTSRMSFLGELKTNMSWDQLEAKHILSLAAAGLVTLYVVHKVRQKKYRLPPGPRPLPILGNLLSLSSESAYLTFTDMSQKYGEMFTIYFGPRCTVVLNNIDVVREAFLKKGVEFADRPVTVTSDLTGGEDSIAFGQYTPRWKIQRKIAHSALRKFATGKPLESLIHRSFSDICTLIDKEQHQPFDPFRKVTLLVYNIMASMVFGKTFESDDPFIVNFTAEIDKFNESFGNGLLADIYPILKYLPNSTLRSVKQLMDKMYATVQEAWDEHLESYNPDELTDFVYLLISTKKEIEREEGPGATSLLENVHYRGILTDMFFAGTDTSRFTLSWVILLAVTHPEVQKKMQKEIDDVVGREQLVGLSHRARLPYTEAVVHEALRIFPIAPIGVPRATSCDVDIRGYTLPKGTWVMPNIWAMHHDPKEWEEPNRFIPERHLDENGALAPKPNSFLPFSTGRRVCVGESVAKVSLHLLTALLFQKYSFAPPDGEELKIEAIPGLQCIPVPYKVVATLRE